MRVAAPWHLLAGRAAPPPRLSERLAEPLDELLRVLFQETSAGLLIADPDGRIVRANDTLRRLVSRRVDLAPGQPASGLFAAAERDMVGNALRPALDGRAPPATMITRLESRDPGPNHRVEVRSRCCGRRIGTSRGSSCGSPI